jgi:hypothetical protein
LRNCEWNPGPAESQNLELFTLGIKGTSRIALPDRSLSRGDEAGHAVRAVALSDTTNVGGNVDLLEDWIAARFAAAETVSTMSPVCVATT